MWHLCYGNVAWGAILSWRYEYGQQRWVWSLWIWHEGAWVPIHLVDLQRCQHGGDDNGEDNGGDDNDDNTMRMLNMGMMVRFYIVLHDFIFISYDYHDH
jgi:hypothetical protein